MSAGTADLFKDKLITSELSQETVFPPFEFGFLNSAFRISKSEIKNLYNFHRPTGGFNLLLGPLAALVDFNKQRGLDLSVA